MFFVVVLSTCFPFIPEKEEHRRWWHLNAGLSDDPLGIVYI